MLIAGNWKMNLTLEESLNLVKAVRSAGVKNEAIKVGMAVPFPYLVPCSELLEESENISIGAQNIHAESNGAFTGETSADMLVSCRIEWTIIGHSERRYLFHESNEVVKAKVERAVASNLGIILCVGEPKEVRNRGEEEDFVSNQLMESLPAELPDSYWSKIVLAYEPVWAIGTGLTASPEQAQTMHAFIRRQMESTFGSRAKGISILYGGSMKPGNASELLDQQDIDGGLIGGASLKAESFIEIIRQAEQIEKI